MKIHQDVKFCLTVTKKLAWMVNHLLQSASGLMRTLHPFKLGMQTFEKVKDLKIWSTPHQFQVWTSENVHILFPKTPKIILWKLPKIYESTREKLPKQILWRRCRDSTKPSISKSPNPFLRGKIRRKKFYKPCVKDSEKRHCYLRINVMICFFTSEV